MLIGAIWIGLISYALPAHKWMTTSTKITGYVASVLGLSTLFDSSETFAILFGALLIFWFLLLFAALPKTFTSWEVKK
ncbi:hypothetical protein [Vibrio sp. NH-UV-68]|uniref:hypothetical protein n=1 Tax=unclassified Vibrio TaxID=2614977 RepID=UPI0036F2EF71